MDLSKRVSSNSTTIMVRLAKQIADCIQDQKNGTDPYECDCISYNDDWTTDDTKEFFRLVEMGFLSQAPEDYGDNNFRVSVEWGHLEGTAEIPEFEFIGKTADDEENGVLKINGETYTKRTILTYEAELDILENYRNAMGKMSEILKDTETPFENEDGENRFFGIEELEDLARDYKKIKVRMECIQNLSMNK